MLQSLSTHILGLIDLWQARGEWVTVGRSGNFLLIENVKTGHRRVRWDTNAKGWPKIPPRRLMRSWVKDGHLGNDRR